MPRNDLIQLRQGTETQWSFTNPVLESGEPGYAIDTKTLKIGDGINGWNSLSSFSQADVVYTTGNQTINGDKNFNILQFNNEFGNITLQNDNGALRIDVGAENYAFSPTLATLDVNLVSRTGSFEGLNVNGTGVSLNGHTHELKIGDGSTDRITYLSSDTLNIVGTGGTSISFNDSSNTITISGSPNLSNVVFTTGNQNISGVKTFTESVSAPTGNWNYLVSTGNILTNFVTPTNIKFKYDNMGIDDITTVDELLKRLVDKALYTQVIASISNNRGTTIQPGTVVSNATYTVSTSAGALSTGYISGTLIPTTYINSVGPYLINFTNSLNSGQNQSYTYTLSYNDTKRVAANSSFLSTTTSIRFIDFKYYGLSRSGDLNNCGNQTNLQNSFTTYDKIQSLNRSLSYTYTATDTNQYYFWYIIPSGGFTQYSLDNNFIPSSNVSVGGFADSNWKFIGSYNLTNTQNYIHPYYFYRYDSIQVGPFSIPVVFN
jgi:hypothetical protein